VGWQTFCCEFRWQRLPDSFQGDVLAGQLLDVINIARDGETSLTRNGPQLLRQHVTSDRPPFSVPVDVLVFAFPKVELPAREGSVLLCGKAVLSQHIKRRQVFM